MAKESVVLVIGAGPTGLVLALWLTKLGVRVRIVDKTTEPGTTSRAVAVQARTLEFYRQIGLAEAVVDASACVEAVNLWIGGRRAARIVFGKMGAGISPYPYALTFAQDEHERLLIDRLASLGVHVERATELVAFEERSGGIRATLRRSGGGEEVVEAAYIAGCDGAHSAVRTSLGVDFPGGTYTGVFYVADIQAQGPVADGELHVDIEDADFVAVFPLKGNGRLRLIGPLRGADGARDLTWDDVSRRAIEHLELDVERVHWFSTYRVHHRVASRFQQGRAFLLGDAAHIHSPVGGQGMNTGIGDAVNLSWKMAAVLRGECDERLLATYEPERIAFARRLVATTDRMFTIISKPGRLARVVRTRVVPLVLPPLVRLPGMRRFLFRTVSQTAVNYRESTLSEGKAGDVHGGDRLPWVPGASGRDNFAALESLDWQAHVYGEAPPGMHAVCDDLHAPLHVFAWNENAKRGGFARDAVYLVRPDGYVGFADASANPVALRKYLERVRQPH